MVFLGLAHYSPTTSRAERRRSLPCYRVKRMEIDKRSNGKRHMQTIELGGLGGAELDACNNEIQRRLKLLISNSLPNVLPLIDAGPIGETGWRSATSEHPEFVRSRVQDKLGWKLSRDELYDVARQLLTGLHALHSIGIPFGIPFGDLQIDDIRFQEFDGTKQFWICSAEYGSVRYDSKNQISRVRSPQWTGAPEWLADNVENRFKPTVRADLYLLGVILCQVTGGLSNTTHPIDPGGRFGWAKPKSLSAFVENVLLCPSPSERAHLCWRR